MIVPENRTLSEQAALETLIGVAKPVIFAAAIRYLSAGATHTVDDVAQEIYLRLYSLIKSDKLSTVTDIQNYIYTMTKNQCLLWNKRNQSHGELSESIADDVHVLSVEQQVVLADAIARLRPPYRTVVDYVLKGFGLPEIGALLGINLNTLKSHYKRSKVMLAKQLGEEAA
ncbi:MAG: RNA polymerase sigma factor [Candidatus Margulisiibacteriota bacterium]|jgi:RNA polymerase sigma factor (sigma-70 family)